MWELFQQILQEKMTPDQFLILYGIKKSLSLPLTSYENGESVKHLKKEGFLYEDGKVSIKGKRVIAKFENYFIKAMKITSLCI